MWCPSIKALMPAPTIIEIKILLEPIPGLGNRAVCLQIYILILYAPPQTFYEHIIHPTAPAIHTNYDALTFKNVNKVIRCKLAALIRIEDLRGSIPCKRLLQRLDT